MFALLSVWIALGAFITSIALVFWKSDDREAVATLLPYTIALSATFAAGVLWGLRKAKREEAGVPGQRTQALTALILESLPWAIVLVWLHGVGEATLGLLV